MKKTVEIPDPTTYGISPKHGFLSPQAPLRQFPNPYYTPWDTLTSALPTLIKSNHLQQEISNLPLLQTSNLTTELEYRRAYVVLAFIIHAHVWCRTPPNEAVPPQLAEPFLEVCGYLRIQPVITYAGLCTWNWTLRNAGGGMTMELENLDVLASFTGTRGEAAFYHVPVLTEFEGGGLVHLLLDAIGAAIAGIDGWEGVVVKALNETSETFVRMAAHMPKLYSILDPQFFYREHRPFMAGGRGMEEKGLQRGMVFQKSNGEEVEMKLVGGSAVQSALFPFLDYVLGVKHVDGTIFQEMRDYMPGPHRSFLDSVSRLASQGLTLREFVIANPSHPELRLAYDKCLHQLRSWRGKHIALVSKYVVQPARAADKAARVEVDGGAETDQEWELQGTGGSAVMPFLRLARDETVGV